MSFDYSLNLLSLSISNSILLFYSEIFGNFVSSRHILNFVKDALIKNSINYNDVNAILINDNNTTLTHIKIFFSVIQSLSLVYNIPIFKINILNAIALELITLKDQRYIFIATKFINDNHLFNIYFKYKKTCIIISKNKCLTSKYFINDNDCLFCIYTQQKMNATACQIFILSKSIYLDIFFRKHIELNSYILPNSTAVSYCENNYIFK